MKALVVPAMGRLEIRDIAEPEPGPYDALVRIECCGICNSTDTKLIDGTMYWAPPFPFVLGHESCGTVTRVGPKVRKFRVGDRVTRPVAFWSGSRPGLNIASGGFAELGIVRDADAMAADGDNSLAEDYTAQRQLVVPSTLTPIEASLAISLSETASMLRHLPNLRGKKVAVAGTGIAGLTFVLWCNLAGATVISIGRRQPRLNEAVQLGADMTLDTSHGDVAGNLSKLAGGKVDGIIEATGDAKLANELLAALSRSGFAAAYGVPPTGVSYNKRWQSLPVEEHLSLHWVCNLLRRGWVKADWFVSHSWSFSDIVSLFDEVREGRVRKGFVRIGT